MWTAITVAHVVPFIAAGIALFLVQPLALPVSLASFAHAWVIPELYAQRGANVVRVGGSRFIRAPAGAEARSVGLLGDLVGHEARAMHAQTGLVPERGRLGVWLAGAARGPPRRGGGGGVWLVGPAGAVLVRAGGGRFGRVVCYCVGVNDPSLPSGDRIAHLLLALRSDEEGFATVANLAFCGARWRVRRRLAAAMRPALDAGAAAARRLDTRAMP